ASNVRRRQGDGSLRARSAGVAMSRSLSDPSRTHRIFSALSQAMVSNIVSHPKLSNRRAVRLEKSQHAGRPGRKGVVGRGFVWRGEPNRPRPLPWEGRGEQSWLRGKGAPEEQSKRFLPLPSQGRGPGR